jgi:hypothetical protein
MTIGKENALWDVTEAVRGVRRANESGLYCLAEQKAEWRQAVVIARLAGASDAEIREAEKEGN